jgi:pimeloyl-ACP methyl ester carboxylesterase
MITLLCLYFIIAHISDKYLCHTRSDGSPVYPYFSERQFNVKKEDFSFPSGQWILHGSRYHFGEGPYRGVLIFFEGIGSGRNAYMKPICLFAKQGYLVYAFDYTGCMESEGPYIYGMGQVVNDEKAFFEWLDHDPAAQGYERYVVGHSWGGYAALIASNPMYKAKRVVSISGFNRVSDEYKVLVPQLRSKLLLFLAKIYLWVRLGKAGNLAASAVLKKSTCPVLYIQGDQDKTVPPSAGRLSLERDLQGQKNVRFLDVPGRGHQCFLSIKSEEYINELWDKKLTSPNGPIGLKMDLETAGEENKELLQTIFDFLSD